MGTSAWSFAVLAIDGVNDLTMIGFGMAVFIMLGLVGASAATAGADVTSVGCAMVFVRFFCCVLCVLDGSCFWRLLVVGLSFCAC